MKHYITLDQREMLEQSSKFPINCRPLLGLVFQFAFEEIEGKVELVELAVRNSNDTRWARHTPAYLENFGLLSVLPAIQKQAEEFFHNFRTADGCGNCRFAIGMNRNICDKRHGHLPKEMTCNLWVRR